MFIVESYSLAVAMCIITMLCWGSWANTQKLASKEWRFQLFYWDYAIGVMLLALVLAFTLGSTGSGGRSFLADLGQADAKWLGSAFLGGVIFNLVEHPPGGGDRHRRAGRCVPGGSRPGTRVGRDYDLYTAKPAGNVPMLAAGVGAVMVAILLDAVAYKRLASGNQKTPAKGIVLSVVAGLLMGFFYSFVAQAMGEIDPSTKVLEAGKLSPYTAIVLFSAGLLVSNFLWNTIMMVRPLSGEPVPLGDYFSKGNARLHAIGILGGVIWNVGMSFNIIASTAAGSALSYGLGQGATMIGAFWGVFIWKEFQRRRAEPIRCWRPCLPFTCSVWEFSSHRNSREHHEQKIDRRRRQFQYRYGHPTGPYSAAGRDDPGRPVRDGGRRKGGQPGGCGRACREAT